MSIELVIIIIALLVTLILLAYMGDYLELDFEDERFKVLPKIRLKFSRRDVEKTTEKQTTPAPDYRIGHYRGEVWVEYGEKAATTMRVSLDITPIKNNISAFRNSNSNSETRFKRISGFKETDTKAIPYRQIPSWTALNASDLHIISLPITTVKYEEWHHLEYELQLFNHYQEIMRAEGSLVHGIYFRLPSSCETAEFSFFVPKGKRSTIVGVELELNTRKLTKKINVPLHLNKAYLLKKNTIYSLRQTHMGLGIKVMTTESLSGGDIINLRWYTSEPRT